MHPNSHPTSPPTPHDPTPVTALAENATLPAPVLHGKHILVGVGGGIAAYKACEVVRMLRKAGATVTVAPTRSAQKFVTPLTFEALSGRSVITDVLGTDRGQIEHIESAYAADAAVVVPATANLMARMAAGMADEALLATLLSVRGPVLACPAMESRMWSHPATQRNVQLLKDDGVTLVGPDRGPLASGRSGAGRLVQPGVILRALEDALSPADFADRHVVITAGPTEEPLDPVRYLSNRSTGKMGIALARAALMRGATVTLVHGPLKVDFDDALGSHPRLTRTPVRTAADMADATLAAANAADMAILAAAVADYTPRAVAAQKIKKTAGAGAPGSEKSEPGLALDLSRTTDILATLGEKRAATGAGPALIGFAAETENVLENAASKRVRKNADMICANDVARTDAGFGTAQNAVTLVTAPTASSPGRTALPLGDKQAVAHAILSAAAAFLPVERAGSRA